MLGLDTIIAWSFKERLEKDLGKNYWNELKEELWKTHNLTISKIIQDDYSKFYLELAIMIGKKGANEIQKKCMKDILKVHKCSQFYKLSFYDNKLGAMIMESYADKTSRNILNDLSGNVKCLPDILDEGKVTHDFNSTTFYRYTKKLIKNGLIVDVQQPTTRMRKVEVSVPQYTSLFEKLTVIICNKIESVTATISKDVKKNSIILDVIQNT